MIRFWRTFRHPLSGWTDGETTEWCSESMQTVKYQEMIKCQHVNSVSVCQRWTCQQRLRVLFFGVFCLQAEWVHSENVTSCLVALHHQLPFLSVFLFTQCLFVYCVKLCSFMLIALCCGVVHSSAGKHLRGYFFWQLAGVFSCSVPLSHFQTYRDANADVHGPNVQGYI